MKCLSSRLGLAALAASLAVACRDVPIQPSKARPLAIPSAPARALSSTGVPLIDLGSAAAAYAINDAGTVVGSVTGMRGLIAARWAVDGALSLIRAVCPQCCNPPQPIPACTPICNPFCTVLEPQDEPSAALGINAAGAVVGYYQYSARPTYIRVQGGFVWTPGGFTNVGWLSGGVPNNLAVEITARAINDGGFIVGRSPRQFNVLQHPFIRSPDGVMRDLGVVLPPGFGDTWADAYAVNASGDVVGYVREQGDHAIRWPAAGGIEDLGAIAGWTSSRAYGINDAGLAVGTGDGLAFIWPEGSAVRILGPGAAYAVNRGGYVVGESRFGGASSHAALWAPDGSATDLGTLGGAFSVAYAINATGQVAGQSQDASGIWHAVRWDAPIAPPNRPPVVAAGGPYAGIEGSSIAFAGTASDPDGDPIAVTWNFGDGATAAGTAGGHVYADDGTYTARLTATDPGGLSANALVQVVVSNAAPVVHVDPLPAIASGDSVAFVGGFSDPGALDRPWRYAVDWGNGATAEGTTTDQSAALGATSSRYCAAGHYPVRLRVTDKDGATGEGSADLIVERTAVPVLVRPATINAGASGKITVAILGTAALDARLVDAASVAFVVGAGHDVPLAPAANGREAGEIRDVNGDGVPDLALRYERDALSSAGLLTASSVQLVLHARLTDHCREVTGAAPLRLVGRGR